MTRSVIFVGTTAFCWLLAGSVAFAQSAATSSSSTTADSVKPDAAPPTTPHAATNSTPAETKKPKKVWTNDNVGSLDGTVSVVGDSKTSPKNGSDTKADPQYIANTRKQLDKLQSQLDDTSKQLADLTEFSSGKTGITSGGYEINKGYNRVPVDQQISNLKAKKTQLEAKIQTLLDEARKKGVEPGDLR